MGLDIDVLECPDCGERLRFVAAIMLSSAIRRILRPIGLMLRAQLRGTRLLCLVTHSADRAFEFAMPSAV